MKKIYFLPTFIFIAIVNIHPLMAQNEVQRVRIDLETPLGYTRQLLLGFTPDNAATDDFDYGYDAANVDNFPDDFNWMINDDRYIIQGVGAFDEIKKYPIGFFLSNSGNINISLNALENFDTVIDVYIYDKQNDSYHQLNDALFNMTIPSGEYTDRFYIAFLEPNLSINENHIDDIHISYSKNAKELTIASNNFTVIKSLKIYNINSQAVLGVKFHENSSSKVSLTDYYLGINIISIETNKGIIYKKVLL